MFAVILKICREVNPEIPESETTKLFDEGFIDSFGAYMILTQLEMEYDIIIEEDEMDYQNFQDIQHIETLVRSKMEAR